MKLKHEFTCRVGLLEVRSCNAHGLSGQAEHTTAQIIKWTGDTCYVVAAYRPNTDERFFNLEHIGDRPCGREIDPAEFMMLAKFGHKMLAHLADWDDDDGL